MCSAGVGLDVRSRVSTTPASLASSVHNRDDHPMNSTTDAVSQPTLYVCRDCGDGIEDPDDTSNCPHCGGRLMDSSVPHD
jgi:DNA-directed RNA polymerase subunit RPC12/RpoP